MTDRELIKRAMEVSELAYAPYSRFKVGAALECRDGSVYTGCNVESSAYGCTLCAEQGAISKAISDGNRRFVRIAIYADSPEYCYPCGKCRQLLSELATECDTEVLCARSGGGYVSYRISQLLPNNFKFAD